jgi:putative glutamine amidotransferase
VDKIGAGLVETGWAVIDDLVEAIEMPDQTYTLGVQWHPEVDPRSGVIRSLVATAAGVPTSA